MIWTQAKEILGRAYDWLRDPGDALSSRVLHGSAWIFVMRIADKGLGLIRTILLARLLDPNDYGLFGIATLSLSSLEAFSQTGFDQALIQKREDPESFLDPAWTVQILRGLVLAALLIAGAPLIGIFFEEPRVVPIIRTLGAAELVKSLRNIGVVTFHRQLTFDRLFLYQLGGTLAALVVAVPAAAVLRSVWALVIGLLALNLIQTITSYLVHDYRPRLDLDLSKIKALFDFGRWRLASSALVFILIQGDDLFLGKILGSTALGLYQMAYKISNLPATEITHVVSQVTFPAYAKLQGKLNLLRRGFSQVIQLTALVSFPLAGGIASLAGPFVLVFLGEKWSSMIPTLQVLTVWGLIRSLDAATSPVWLGMGKPHLPTTFQFAKAVLLAVLIYPLTIQYGVLGTALAVVIQSVVVHLWRFWAMGRTLECGPTALYRLFLAPALATGLMSGSLVAVTHLLPTLNLATFVGLVLVGGVVYCLGILTIGPILGFDYRTMTDQFVAKLQASSDVRSNQ